MPIKEVVKTGRSVEAAIDAACEELGCERADCNWEIIDLPKKGFLGIKNIPAKVSVSIEIEEEAPAAVLAPAAPAVQPKAERNERKETKKSYTRENDGDRRKYVYDKAKVDTALSYIKDVISGMGLEAEYEVKDEDGGVYINLTGKGLGALIGRRGETLDAVQYLASLVANRASSEYMRVTVDCCSYRYKRKETLESLAKKLASQVIKQNVSKTLEPMNPFERRIIHAAISEIPGVSSTSIGEEPNRRIIIKTPTSKSAGRDRGYPSKKPPYNKKGRDSGRDGGYSKRPGGQRSSGPRRSSAPKSDEEPKKTVESSLNNDSKLYTKLDLD